MKIKPILVCIATIILLGGCASDEPAATEIMQTETVEAIQEYEPEYLPAEAGLTAALFPFEFEVEDLYGNIVTHETMGERELFLLYFWTTLCPMCVNGMPAMAALAEEFYDRMGFVSLLGDFDTGLEAAIRLTEEVNARFFTVDIMHEDLAVLIPFVSSPFVPTSALIDAEGNKIGDMIIGSDINAIRGRIIEALEDK